MKIEELSHSKRKSTKNYSTPEWKNQLIGELLLCSNGNGAANFLSVCRRVTTTYEKFQTSWRHPKESKSRAS